MPETEFKKTAFNGGLNQGIDSIFLPENAYPIGKNIRTRYGLAEPILRPVEDPIIGFNVSKVQGGFAVTNYLIVVADGKVFYKDVRLFSNLWTQIAGVQLSADADQVWLCAVPAASLGYTRQGGTDPTSEIVLQNTGNDSTPAALVLQDGVTQPWLVFPNLTARQAKTWNDWSLTNREYVPVGKQMIYAGGVLYVVAPDGYSIYRSCTNRPLDFLIPITDTGDKILPESASDAASVSFAITGDPVTCLFSLGTENEDFIVGSAYNTYVVHPDRTANLIYGEPVQYNRVNGLDTGPLTNFCVVDILGDTALVDADGIKSYNATQSLRVSGKNSPFSQSVAGLFRGITQSTVAAVGFDNYAIFGVNTIFGFAHVVFDTMSKVFVSLDTFEEITTATKQFVNVKTSTNHVLYAITADNRLFQLYAGAVAPAAIYAGDWAPNTGAYELQPQRGTCVFVDVVTGGIAKMSLYGDNDLQTSRSKNILTPSVAPTAALPLYNGGADRVRPQTFVFEDAKVCWKAGLWLEWEFQAKVSNITLWTNVQTPDVAIEATAQSYYDSSMGTPEIAGITPTSGLFAGKAVTITGNQLNLITQLELDGVVFAVSTTESDVLSFFVPATWSGKSGELVVYTQVGGFASGYTLTIT